MKYFTSTFLILVLGGVSSRLEAQMQSTPATIYLNQGGNPQGFITASAPAAIKFATTEQGASRIVQLSEIRGNGLEKGIRLEARSEVLADARAAFSAKMYIDSAKGFAQVVKDYFQLVGNIPQNFASEAMFYQVESFRRLGNYKALGPLLESPAGKSTEKLLSDRYKNLIRLQKLWAVYGTGDMAALETALATYQAPVVGKAGLLPAPNFNKMPQNELVQISFLRAKVYESKDKKPEALEDYFRVFTMAFADDDFLSKQAMGASLVILSENPKLKSEDEKVRKGPLREIQSVAYFFSRRFPDTTMPAQFQEYAVMPDVDVVLAVKEEEPPAEAKPKEGDKPAAPAPKGKGAAPSALFVKLDTDKDGKISEKEFLKGAAGKNNNVKKRNFKAKDKDKNGSLSPAEL